MVMVRTGTAMFASFHEKLLSSQCHPATNKVLLSFEDYQENSYSFLSEIHSIMQALAGFLSVCSSQ